MAISCPLSHLFFFSLLKISIISVMAAVVKILITHKCNDPHGQINYLVIDPMVRLLSLFFTEQDSGISLSSS
jgi:hypothetical protein